MLEQLPDLQRAQQVELWPDFIVVKPLPKVTKNEDSEDGLEFIPSKEE